METPEEASLGDAQSSNPPDDEEMIEPDADALDTDVEDADLFLGDVDEEDEDIVDEDIVIDDQEI